MGSFVPLVPTSSGRDGRGGRGGKERGREKGEGRGTPPGGDLTRHKFKKCLDKSGLGTAQT